MTRPLVALAAAAGFDDLDGERAPMTEALGDRGVDVDVAVWDDASVDWARFDAVVVRATWDYSRRRDDFLAWAERVAATTRLANPYDVIRWNTDKRYLRELEAQGLPVVHTEWLEPGDALRVPAARDYVVKPAVSAGSRDTNRYHAGEDDHAADEHVRRLHEAGKTVMVQPYLEGVDTHGETAMLFFAGEWSHAIRKGPLLERLGGPVEGWFKREQIDDRRPSDVERERAERVLEALPWPRRDLTYARVDLVPDVDGPTVIEVELTEPSMFLDRAPHAADRFAAAIAALVGVR